MPGTLVSSEFVCILRSFLCLYSVRHQSTHTSSSSSLNTLSCATPIGKNQRLTFHFCGFQLLMPSLRLYALASGVTNPESSYISSKRSGNLLQIVPGTQMPMRSEDRNHSRKLQQMRSIASQGRVPAWSFLPLQLSASNS